MIPDPNRNEIRPTPVLKSRSRCRTRKTRPGRAGRLSRRTPSRASKVRCRAVAENSLPRRGPKLVTNPPAPEDPPAAVRVEGRRSAPPPDGPPAGGERVGRRRSAPPPDGPPAGGGRVGRRRSAPPPDGPPAGGGRVGGRRSAPPPDGPPAGGGRVGGRWSLNMAATSSPRPRNTRRTPPPLPAISCSRPSSRARTTTNRSSGRFRNSDEKWCTL